MTENTENLNRTIKELKDGTLGYLVKNPCGYLNRTIKELKVAALRVPRNLHIYLNRTIKELKDWQ